VFYKSFNEAFKFYKMFATIKNNSLIQNVTRNFVHIEYTNVNKFYRLLQMTGFLAFLVSVIFFLYINAEKEFDKAHEIRFDSHGIADELLQTSNDLSRMVRTYVVTRDPKYKKAYFDILAIRDGKKERPGHYHAAYWDLYLSSTAHHEIIIEPKPLLSKLQDIGITEEEYKVLQTAKNASDALSLIEKKAFELVDSSNSNSKETFHAAIDMLHDAAYHQSKATIMHSISDFDNMVDIRTEKLMKDNQEKVNSLQFLLLFLIIILLGLLWQIYRSLNTILGTSIRDLHTFINQVGSQKSAVEVKNIHENSILDWIVKIQHQLIATYQQYDEALFQNKRLKELYMALAQCNEAIIRSNTAQELYPKICQDAVIHGGLKMAWIGVLDPNSNSIKPISWYGEGTNYLDDLSISLDFFTPTSHGPSAKAMVEKYPQWIQDFQNDVSTSPWHEKASEFGWKASAALPLFLNGETVAVLNLYADKTHFFDDSIQQLLTEMASDISFALKAYHQKEIASRLEEERQESYLLLKTVIDIAPIRIFWKDTKLRYLGCNQIFAHDAGFNDPRDIIGKNDFELSWKEQAELYRSDDQTVLESGIPKLFFEEIQTTPNGDTVWLRTSKVPLKNIHGEIIGLLGMYEDITQHKTSHIALQKEKDKAQNYLDIVGVMILVLDNDKNVLLINKRGCEIMGYSAEEMIGKNWIEHFLPERIKTSIYEIGETLVHKESKHISYFENPVLTKSGEERLIAWRNTTITDDNGNITGILTSGEDITEFKAASKALEYSQRRLQSIVDNEPECVKVVSPEGILVEMNPAGLKMLEAQTLQEAQSRPLLEYLLPQWRGKFMELHEKVMQGGEETLEFEILGLHGTHRWLESHAAPLKDSDGHVTSVLAVTRDISERKLAEEQLHKLSQAVEQSPNAIVITDIHGNIDYINDAFTATTGYSAHEVIGQNPRFLQSSKTSPSLYKEMWSKLTQGERWEGEFINKHKNGDEYIQFVIVTPIIDQTGRTTHFMAIEEDVTDKKRNEERIHFLANFDSLTGLPNRAQMEDHLNYTLSLARRNNGEFALMFLDLDHFKDINDSLGHKVGDDLLVKLSQRLKSVLREEDTLSRQGGDEFVLLLPGADAHASSIIARKLLDILNKPFNIGHYELTVTISIGIALYPNDGNSIETLSKNADTAMYRSKQEGRNSFRFYTEEMQQRSIRNLELSNALHHAIENQELYLTYQPQISSSDLHIIGAEALLRWKHPVYGNISPIEFIPIAEDNGLILPIGEWVLRTAIAQAKKWLDSDLPPLIMAVNLSAVQFRHPKLSQLITSILEEEQFPPEYLEIELTERMAMHDPEQAIIIMDQLHSQGIRMSMDDFGTGYSSLSYLKKFNIYKLKIDQSFVRDISTDAEDKAIVGAIIDMAKGLDLLTIAEGVETHSQLEFLQQQGCDEIQGYLFSKPLLPEEFEIFAQNNQKENN